MRPDAGRRPRHAASRRIAAALLSAVVLVGVVSVPAPHPVLASTPMTTACDGVRLRTGPSTGDSSVATLTVGTQVSVETTVTGGAWSAACASNPTSGDGWHQISAMNGQSVAALYGVPFVYAATGLFQTIATPTPTPSPTPTLPVTEGIDVSHWQNTIDWPQVAAAGKRFAYMKASEGTDLVDATYSTNRAQAKAVGLYVGAYHFARPDQNPGDAVAEADYFLAMSQLAAGDLPPVLDLEVSGGLSPVELQEWVKAYLGRVYERTGAHGVLYVSPTFWKNSMSDTTWFGDNGYRTLWVAHWTGGSGATIPAGNWSGSGWTFWQYTSSGVVPGITGRVDLDRFNGLDLTPLLLTAGVTDPAVLAPTLTLTPSASVITWGETMVVKASFGPAGAGRTFALQGAVDGLSWLPITTLTTDAAGSASFSYRPATNLFYRGVFDGAPDLPPVTSNTARVVVREVALLRPIAGDTSKVVSRGRKVTFTTTVRPARADLPPAKVTFAIYRRVGSSWAAFTTRAVYIDAAGLASYTWTFATRGEWYVRSIANPTAFNANSAWSPIERYTVR